jgi:uncharacterized protein
MELPSDSSQAPATVVPLFPLPSVILFPGAVLPLHIFEERYKAMTADALAGNRLIAMALLRPGWERDYYCKPAIESVVCIGRIARWERLEDGKYNFLLHGQTRARILAEDDSSPYRVARVEALMEKCVPESALACRRKCLAEMFLAEPLVSLPMTAPLRRIIASDIPTAAVADLIAFHALTQIPLKMSLLAETDVPRRIDRIISALKAALPVMELAARGAVQGADYN